MKHMKKVLALMLAVVMTLAMSVTAFADDPEPTATKYSITIPDLEKDPAVGQHTYEAYQIFTGKLDETTDATTGEVTSRILSSVKFGAAVKDNTSAFIGALKDSGVASLATLADNAEAQAVSEALAAVTSEENIKKVAAAIDKYIQDNNITANANSSYNSAEKKSVISNLDAGYYFVKDRDNSLDAFNTTESHSAYTRFMLQVAGNVSVAPKTDVPEIQKKIKNEGESDAAYRDSNNVKIGDKVNYQIKSAVPDMKDYTKYYFIVNDELSEGLDYEGNLVVKIGNNVLNIDEDYIFTQGTNATTKGTTLEIVFKNFIQYLDNKGEDIIITYDAKLNSKCKVGVDGNPNKVNLKYSNNPNNLGDGENKPTDDSVLGITPDDWTITYTTKVKLFKKDGKENTALPGVTFVLTGTKKNYVETVTEVFTEDSEGTFWKLKDGTYTETAPNVDTEDQYESTDTKYKKDEVSDITETITKVGPTEMTTDSSGYIDLGSIAAGEYTLTEKEPLPGYNPIEPITFTVDCKNKDNSDVIDKQLSADGTEKCTWIVKQGSTTLTEGQDGYYEMTALNYKGAVLPITGGIGTTMFYVLGFILIIGAGVVLVTRRRMAA